MRAFPLGRMNLILLQMMSSSTCYSKITMTMALIAVNCNKNDDNFEKNCSIRKNDDDTRFHHVKKAFSNAQILNFRARNCMIYERSLPAL